MSNRQKPIRVPTGRDTKTGKSDRKGAIPKVGKVDMQPTTVNKVSNGSTLCDNLDVQHHSSRYKAEKTQKGKEKHGSNISHSANGSGDVRDGSRYFQKRDTKAQTKLGLCISDTVEQSLAHNDLPTISYEDTKKGTRMKELMNRNLGSDNKSEIDKVDCKKSRDRPKVASETRVYGNNTQNRRLIRVGLPVGEAVYSSKTKTVQQKVYKDTPVNRKYGRVGKPLGSMPIPNRSSITKNIPELLKRIEDNDDFKELTFRRRTASNGHLDFRALDSNGETIKAFDQAMYRYNRNQAEQSWKMTNATKEAPKTQAAIIQNYRGKKIKFDDLKLHKVIGKGGFGLVYFAKLKDAVVAVKKINNEKISKSRIDDFAKEIEKFCTLEHKNIVKFIGACVEKSHPCIVMEYMQMTLYDALHIRNDIEFSEYEQDDMIRQICDGMHYLHNKRIVHCDLKTSNILVDYAEDICEVKITDFGLSMVVHDVSVSVEELVQNIGTPQYSSPEMLRGEILSAKDMMRADVYALAMIFLEVIFIEEPFPNYGYLQFKKEVGERGNTPIIPKEPSIDRRVRDIMNRSWRNDPVDRPTMARICSILREIHTIFVK